MSWTCGIDYEAKTNFWDVFSLIETSGEKEIRKMTETLYNSYKDQIVFLTELIMILNHKCWYWYEKNNQQLSKLYGDLYYEYDDIAINYIDKNMTQEEMRYYFQTLD